MNLPEKWSVLPCQYVSDKVFVVRVSARKYRLACLVSSGNGYSNGYTNVRELEFLTEPFSRSELHDMLLEHGECVPAEYHSDCNHIGNDYVTKKGVTVKV